MRRKLLLTLVLAFAVLSLTGESCVLEDTEVEVPVRADMEFLFEARGDDPVDNDFEIVDIADFIADVTDSVDIDELVAVYVEAGYWHVVRNGGSTTITLAGEVSVTHQQSGETEALIEYQSGSIASVTGPDFFVAPLESAGIELVTDKINEYITAVNADDGSSIPDLTFRFDWNTESSPPPPPDLDFDWEGKLRITVVGRITVSVPDVL